MNSRTRPQEAVVGRGAELATLAGALTPETAAQAVVLAGEPGIGKTTLWESGIATAEEQGTRVLVARPAVAEAEYSFAGLGDLLEEVDDAALAALPDPQRRSLEAALLRTDPSGTPPGPRTIAVAVLGVLRRLGGTQPLLVAVDDVQWLDQASAQALAFAGRRLGDDPVRFLLTIRVGHKSTLLEAFPNDAVTRLDLGALSFGAIRSLLGRRPGPDLTRRVLRQVFDASGGNPLFALEIGRLIAERGTPEVGDDLPSPGLVDDLVGARVRRLSVPVRKLLLAVALTPGLTREQLQSLGSEGALEQALEDGVLVLEGMRVRAAHPLLAAAARAGATERERSALHLELAEVALDEEPRVRHLARGTGEPDEALSSRLVAAAARASARGAAWDAAELATYALRLTPPESDERGGRLLDLAERLVVAGEPIRARELLAAEWELIPPGPLRVRAHLLLEYTGTPETTVDEGGAHLQRALEESSADPALHARVAARWSRYLAVGRVERIEEAERWAHDTLPDAREVGPAVEREVLYALAFARKLRGLPIDDLLERFRAVSDDAFHLQHGVERIAADRLATRGRVREARAAFRRLLELADERGEAWSSNWLLQQLCELELWAGEWEEASRLLAESDESPDRALIDTHGYGRCRALLAAGRGEVEQAEWWADRVIEACEARGLRWNLLEAWRARGVAALLARRPERAAESLGAVWTHTEREGVEEPAEFPVAPDLVEALVELGRFDEARAVSERLRGLAERQEHPWGLASAVRCDALLALASNRDEGALARLDEAAEAYEELGLRFDHARTLLAAGRAGRRLRKWGVARSLLERTVAAFEAMGSPGWVEEARAELARLGARRSGASGDLTAAELRVATLAAEGLSNKEIAGRLTVTVSTVETHLKRVFAKLGVQSRSQLGRSLSRVTPG